MEEIQGAAACSFYPPPILQDSWLCVLLMFPECNAPYKRDLVLDKARSTAFTAAQRQSHDQPDLQCKARGCGYYQINKLLAQLEIDYLDVIRRERKGFADLGTLNDSVAQLRQFATCR